MARQLREVVFVDGVRTPFGKAGAAGLYAETRADDMVVKVIRELLRHNPQLPPERVDDVAIAATTQTGDQGLTIGRSAAILAGLPSSVPGYAIDRMCAGAMTAVTTTASGIAFGAYVAIAGGVEHMSHHPMGDGVDPNPRFLAELRGHIGHRHGLYGREPARSLPRLTRARADEFAVLSQERLAKAYADGKVQQDLVPVAVRSAEQGWGLATEDEPPRPGDDRRGAGRMRTPFRPHGQVTAGNAAGLNDGATGIVAAEDAARELDLPARMRLVGYAFAGVEPEVMGVGPIPATEKVLRQTGLSIDDIGDRDQRSVRRPGSRVSRSLPHRRRRFACQSVGRRDRGRAPTRVLRRTTDDAIGSTLRGAPECGTGSRRCASASAWAAPSSGRTRDDTGPSDEVVTSTHVRYVELPLDADGAADARQRPRPHPAQHLRSGRARESP